MLSALNIDVVLRFPEDAADGQKAPTLLADDRYAIPREMGILRDYRSGFDLSIRHIAQRVRAETEVSWALRHALSILAHNAHPPPLASLSDLASQVRAEVRSGDGAQREESPGGRVLGTSLGLRAHVLQLEV